MSDKVECDVDYDTIENGKGGTQDGVRVTCGRCSHTTESFGTSVKSIKRCLVMLREGCPRGEENFYTCEETEDED